jgi:hypothetical protein
MMYWTFRKKNNFNSISILQNCAPGLQITVKRSEKSIKVAQMVCSTICEGWSLGKWA